MSKSFTKASSMYLSGTLTGYQPTSCTVAVAFKVPSIGGNYHGLFSLRGSGSAYLQSQVNSIAQVVGYLRNNSGVSPNDAESSAIGSGWEIAIIRFDNAGDAFKVFCTAGDSSAQAFTDYFLGAPLPDLQVGALASSNYLGGKIGYIAIYSSALSDTACANLKSGKHPADAANVGSPAHLWDWVNGTSLTDSVGGITLTNNNGVTHDGGDNPTVDAPPAGSGISLQMIERGRGVARGLGRGL